MKSYFMKEKKIGRHLEKIKFDFYTKITCSPLHTHVETIYIIVSYTSKNILSLI